MGNHRIMLLHCMNVECIKTEGNEGCLRCFHGSGWKSMPPDIKLLTRCVCRELFCHCRLPAMSREANNMMEAYLKNGKFVLLLLYGYHKSSQITRRVFRATCIAYMEYNGLALPMLFEKVSELYAVPKDRLWEMMSETKQVNSLQALFTIADYYYTVYEAGNTKTFELFPFCRVYGQMYHSNMSGKCEENYEACYALALLVDKKLGMEKSFMRNSAWTKQFSCVWQNKGAAIATEVYKKIMEQNV